MLVSSSAVQLLQPSQQWCVQWSPLLLDLYLEPSSSMCSLKAVSAMPAPQALSLPSLQQSTMRRWMCPLLHKGLLNTRRSPLSCSPMMHTIHCRRRVSSPLTMRLTDKCTCELLYYNYITFAIYNKTYNNYSLVFHRFVGLYCSVTIIIILKRIVIITKITMIIMCSICVTIIMFLFFFMNCIIN